MKKFALLLALGLLVEPAFSATYYYKATNTRPAIPYTSTTYNFMPRRYSYIDFNNPDMLFLQGLLAGTSLYNGRLSMRANPQLRNSGMGMLSYLDPYIIRIDGTDYVLVKDSKDGKWSVENILGYNDSKSDLFASLKKLESDGNSSKISTKELINADIRFVKLNSDGSLVLQDKNQDYDINNVLYIDMKNLRTALGNKNQDGTFGYFYVYIKNGNGKKAVPGRVTFEEKSELNKYIKYNHTILKIEKLKTMFLYKASCSLGFSACCLSYSSRAFTLISCFSP